jgi:hypothetical protein
LAAHGLAGAVLAIFLAGCTAMFISGDNAQVKIVKTGTDVDTETEIDQKKGPTIAGPDDLPEYEPNNKGPKQKGF